MPSPIQKDEGIMYKHEQSHKNKTHTRAHTHTHIHIHTHTHAHAHAHAHAHTLEHARAQIREQVFLKGKKWYFVVKIR